MILRGTLYDHLHEIDELVHDFVSADGNSALMLVCARLRHVVSTVWGTKRYMSMKTLDELSDEMISSVG